MIKLIIIILLFLVSLLTIFKAPIYYLWLLAIIVTEFPLILVSVTIVLLVSGIWLPKYQLASTVLGLAALLLFLSPIIRSYLAASTLKQNFAAAFGNDAAASDAPFSFFKQLTITAPIAYRTLTYTSADTALRLDYYPATAKVKRPCVIVVHGGSWSSGDRKQLPELNSYLAAHGYNVVAIDYRMAPKHQCPAPVEDVQQVVAYLCKHAVELQIDTNQFILLGRSAGAQIALLAAYTKAWPGLKGVIDFYGPADMVWGYSVPSNPLIMDSRGVMRSYLGGSYQKVPQNYVAGSPIEFVSRQTVPTLIIHGDNDVLVSPEHSRRLNEKLQQNGIKHYLLKLPWATHGFDYDLNGPGGQLSTYAVKHFLNAVTQ